MDEITGKVKYFLTKHNLMNTKNNILVAFSGGYDSMCLLDILSEFNLNILAIHLNHNWRGEESDKEEENCRFFCKSKKIDFYCEKLPAGLPRTETAARKARYDFFENCAKKFNSTAVLTAHNANDNAETIIYRMVKGTGITGLCGISEKREIFYRPLLNVQRGEIEEYCRQKNLTPNCDSSNIDLKYKRNLIRQNILPELEKINPEVINALNTLAKTAQNDNSIIDEYLKTLNEPFETEKFIKLSKPVQLRLLHDLLLKKEIDFDKRKIERILNFVLENKNSKSGKKYSITGNIWIFTNNKRIELITGFEKTDLEIEITGAGNYEFENKIFSITKIEKKPLSYPKDSQCMAYANLEGIKSLIIRHRKEGDIIKPLGAGGTQKLKKYLNEKKVPSHEKDKLIFLASGNEILWAPSLGISEKIKVVTVPTHMLKLTDMEI